MRSSSHASPPYPCLQTHPPDGCEAVRYPRSHRSVSRGTHFFTAVTFSGASTGVSGPARRGATAATIVARARAPYASACFVPKRMSSSRSVTVVVTPTASATRNASAYGDASRNLARNDGRDVVDEDGVGGGPIFDRFGACGRRTTRCVDWCDYAPSSLCGAAERDSNETRRARVGTLTRHHVDLNFFLFFFIDERCAHH